MQGTWSAPSAQKLMGRNELSMVLDSVDVAPAAKVASAVTQWLALSSPNTRDKPRVDVKPPSPTSNGSSSTAAFGLSFDLTWKRHGSALSAEHAGAVLSIWAANSVPLAALWNVAAIAGTCSRATRRSLCSTREPPLAASTARSRCGDALRWRAGRFEIAPGVPWSTAPRAATAACAHGC